MRLDSYGVSLGISFVPISSETKTPYHAEWTDPSRVFTEADFRPTDNTGGRWGEPSGDLVDLDHDTAFACRAGEKVFAAGPRWGRTGKPHSHVLVRCPSAKTRQFKDPISGQVIVEIRSTGSQSVLPPSTHPSGDRYEWERRGEPEYCDPAQLTRDVGEVAAAAFIASLWTGGRHKFAVALAGFFAKNGMPRDRALWLIELITHTAQDDEVRDRLRAVEDTYARFGNGEDVSGNFGEVLTTEQTAIFLKTITKWLDLTRKRFRINGEHALLSRAAAPFIVKDLLVRGSLVGLVSEPGKGKSFLATDLALSLAAGQDQWLGRRLTLDGPVLYVIAEGLGRFKYRLMAWKQVRNVRTPLPFNWIDEAVNLLDPKTADAFIAEVAPLKPVLVVFDTLSRCLMGGNENSQEDMGQAIAVCDELRARTGATVLLIHHTKKDGTVERGSTVLRGALDTLLLLKETAPGVLELTCEKQKDADAFAPLVLARRTIQLDGVVEPDTGEPASSCVIRLASPAEVAKTGLHSRIAAWVAAHPGATKNDVVAGVGGRKAGILEALTVMRDSGDVRFAGTGRGAKTRIWPGDLLDKSSDPVPSSHPKGVGNGNHSEF